jgi:hypothetical protein
MHVQDAITLRTPCWGRPRTTGAPASLCDAKFNAKFKAQIKESETMPELDRRGVLGAMLGGIAIAGSASLLVATTTRAAPLPGLAPTTSTSGPGPVKKAQVVVVGPRHRRRRRRCWWSRGRRVCGWRW